MAEETGCCICFTNKTKARCAVIVLYVSILLVVLGLAVAIYGYFGLDIEDEWKIDDETTFPSPLALFGVACILLGLFTVVTGVLGALTSKCKNVCFAMPFSIFATVLSVAMIVVAFVGLVGQNDSAKDTVRKEFCEGGNFSVGGKSFTNLNNYMIDMYGSSVDRYMCTKWCPCPDDRNVVDAFTQRIEGGFPIGND